MTESGRSAIDTLREACEGRLMWEGVGPKPWWAAFDDVVEKLAAFEALLQAAEAVRVVGSNHNEVFIDRKGWVALAAAVRRVRGESA